MTKQEIERAALLMIDLGYSDFMDALADANRMRDALNTLHTWARMSRGFVPEYVLEVIEGLPMEAKK